MLRGWLAGLGGSRAERRATDRAALGDQGFHRDGRVALAELDQRRREQRAELRWCGDPEVSTRGHLRALGCRVGVFEPQDFLPRLTVKDGTPTAFSEKPEIAKFMAGEVVPKMAAPMGWRRSTWRRSRASAAAGATPST